MFFSLNKKRMKKKQKIGESYVVADPKHVWADM